MFLYGYARARKSLFAWSERTLQTVVKFDTEYGVQLRSFMTNLSCTKRILMAMRAPGGTKPE